MAAAECANSVFPGAFPTRITRKELQIERFIRTVREQFLVEVIDTRSEDLTNAGVHHAAALPELNRLLTAWVEMEPPQSYLVRGPRSALPAEKHNCIFTPAIAAWSEFVSKVRPRGRRYCLQLVCGYCSLT
jgi:hypothetical protein